MQARVDFVTLRVEDLDAATTFYADELGWEPLLQVPGEVTFFQIGHGLVLSLFNARDFDAETGGKLQGKFTLAHNPDSEQGVREVVEEMVQAGAAVLKEPQWAAWGGFHALLEDPSGVGWEIAYNPGWSVDADGAVHLGTPPE